MTRGTKNRAKTRRDRTRGEKTRGDKTRGGNAGEEKNVFQERGHMAKRRHEKTRDTVPEKGDAPLHVPTN